MPGKMILMMLGVRDGGTIIGGVFGPVDGTSTGGGMLIGVDGTTICPEHVSVVSMRIAEIGLRIGSIRFR